MLDEVALFRISFDKGRGDLKVSFQTIFSDDSVFFATNRKDRAASTSSSLDAGVKHTFVVGLMNGADENYETISLLFESLD